MDRQRIWPIFGLRVRTPMLLLRPVEPELAFEVAELAAGGIHDPAEMPFYEPWTDVEPPELQRNTIRHCFRSWSTFAADDWSLHLAVFEGEVLVGIQSVIAAGFPELRQFRTGSWLGRPFQGRGIGKEMRAAVLHLGFAGLGATRALTDAFSDNAASLAVTRALGYEENGSTWELRRGEPAECLSFSMSRARWETIRRDDIGIDGLDATLLDFLGLAAA